MSDISLANQGPSVETTVEVEEYCAAVREALSDLPAEARDDLLEDLADHLAEVSAEDEGTLHDRLGDPADYALDLRAAAGYEAPPSVDDVATGLHDKLSTALRRGLDASAQADQRLGRLVGYARVSQLVRALAPGWWVLRGWILAQLFCAHRDGGWSFIPHVGNSLAFGGAITLAIIVVSVLVGRSTGRWSRWPRRAAYAASVAVAVWGVVVLAPYVSQPQYSIQTVPADSSPYVGVSDLYVYDQAGNLVPNARLYDQDGNPLQLGDPDCADSDRGAASVDLDPVTGAPISGDWTYPLCSNDPDRPFRSGPGPVVLPGSSGASTSTTTTVPPAPLPTSDSAPAASSSPAKPKSPITAASSTNP